MTSIPSVVSKWLSTSKCLPNIPKVRMLWTLFKVAVTRFVFLIFLELKLKLSFNKVLDDAWMMGNCAVLFFLNTPLMVRRSNAVMVLLFSDL